MSPQLEAFQLEMGQTAQFVMSASLFFMMLAVALGLSVRDFQFIRTSPRLFFAGFLSQLILLPFLTLLLVMILRPHPGIALGMLLVACCPGGNVSNMLVLLARGNTALSVSMTASSSVIAAFVTPVAIIFWTSLYHPTKSMLDSIDIDRANFLVQTTIVLAVPLFIGMLVARFLPELAQRVRKPLVMFASTALLLIIAVTLFKAGDYIISVGGAIVGIVAVHNACAFGCGYLIAHLINADVASRRAVTFELGIQNSGLGIVIIMSQLGGAGPAAAIAGLWGVWHIVAGSMLVVMFRYSDSVTRNT